MDYDAAQNDIRRVLSLVEEQMRELSVMQQKQAALTGTGTAADGMVEVRVDARRIVTETVIDEAYLTEFEFGDLAGHITTAAQAAVEQIEQRAEALLAPLLERRQEITSLSTQAADAPEFRDFMAGLSALAGQQPRRGGEGADGMEEQVRYPTVRNSR
ncbi:MULTISPECIES: YbaB/EbfC family nucleoid-associated protein [unclassified Mycobacterium]|uniref:YbaB/EbfC family nucleoid-associated protein n=1 Tax=unclassified Mycobacterium TaxID=2642494 RepID=UPI000ABCA3FA|nr:MULTISPECIES: YbaB/EbfC family nucleoid-associated protein [unclassified Mycobacterium]